jgi:hypothetical protein
MSIFFVGSGFVVKQHIVNMTNGNSAAVGYVNLKGVLIPLGRVLFN